MQDKPRYEGNTEGLRSLLFDTLLDVQSGRMETARGAVVANLSKSLIATLDIELKVQKQLKEMGGKGDDSHQALILAPPAVKLISQKPAGQA